MMTGKGGHPTRGKVNPNSNTYFTPLERKRPHLYWDDKDNKFMQGLKLCLNFLTGLEFLVFFIIFPPLKLKKPTSLKIVSEKSGIMTP
jgi:hypothetical protein